MSVVANFFMGLASAGGVYFWAKTQLTKPDLATERDLFPSRGVPLAKRARAAAAGDINHAKTSVEVDQVVDLADKKKGIVVEFVAKPEPVVEDVTPLKTAPIMTSTDVIPEDSVLKRHYLTRCISEREAITHPYPTDSVLRRHRESMLAFSLLQDRNIEQQGEAAESHITTIEPQSTPKNCVAIPEDSVLKRHFLAQLQADIEQGLPPKPSDATLKRHYAQLLQSKLNDLLSER